RRDSCNEQSRALHCAGSRWRRPEIPTLRSEPQASRQQLVASMTTAPDLRSRWTRSQGVRWCAPFVIVLRDVTVDTSAVRFHSSVYALLVRGVTASTRFHIILARGSRLGFRSQ